MESLFSPCSSPFFPMRCDVYYAVESQDKYGKINKSWQFDGTVNCSFYAMNDDSNKDNFQYDDKKFYRMETTLMGRMKTDVRQSSDGKFFPISNVLITNVRAGCEEDSPLYYETNGGYEGKPTVFEVIMVQPFIGPFNKPDYFRMQIQRSDTQELTEHASR